MTRLKMYRFQGLALALFGLLLSLPVLEVPGWAATIIVGLGDSITAGYPYNPYSGNGCRCGGYIPILESLLRNSGMGAVVYNYGVPGEYSFQGLNRLDAVLTYSGAHMVLLMEGTNDLYFYSPSTTLVSMSTMVDKALARGVVPILATITPDPNVYSGSSGSRVKPIEYTNGLLRNWVQNRNVAFCEQYAALAPRWPYLQSGDYLHPNLSGYQVMAETWKTVVLHPSLYYLPKVPNIAVSAQGLSFGEVFVSHEADKVLTVSNTGNADLYIGVVAADNPLDAPFKIIQNNCYSKNIAPGSSCTVTVNFKPTGIGGFSDSFNLPSNDPDSAAITVTTDGTGRSRGLPWLLLLQDRKG